MNENLSAFFAGLDSKQVTFHLDSGDRIVTAYFDNAFFNTQIGETVLDTTAPRLTCVQSDILGIPLQTPVTVDGKLFSLYQVQPEGTGFATLQLAIEPNDL